MSTNLATLMVGLGYDLSALEKGSPEAFRLINSQTLGMSAEMKRASREGAEAFRSLDEMIGIHINRPMTRLLVETFPQFGKALADALGGVAFGAVAFAGVELFERIAKGIENAKKAQEDYSKAMQHTDDVMGEMGATHARTMKEIALEFALIQGQPGAKLQLGQFKIDTSAMGEAKKNLEEITKALEGQSKAAEKAHGFWLQLVSAFVLTPYDFWGKLLGGANETTDKLKETDALVTLIMRKHAGDPMTGLKESLKEVEAEAKVALTEMTALQQQNAGLSERAGHFSPSGEFVSGPNARGGVGGALDESALESGQEKAYALAQTVIGLNEKIKSIKGAIDEAMGKDKIDAVTEALENQKKAAADLSSFYRDIAAAQAKLVPEDPFAKINEELSEMRSKALANLAQLTSDVQKGIVPKEVLDRAQTAFLALTQTTKEGTGQMATYHDSLLDKLKQELELMEEIKQVSTIKPMAGPFTGTSVPGLAEAPAPAAPEFSGSTISAKLAAFAKDTAAQQKLVAQAFQDAISPAEQYQLKLQELRMAFAALPADLKNTTEAQNALADATRKLGEEMTKAQLHLQEMEKELERLLAHSTSATDGVRAFFLELQIDASQNGKFAFDILTQALHGFNDELARSLVTGKSNWREYFRSIEESAIKFGLTKGEGAIFQGLGSAFPSVFGQSGANDSGAAGGGSEAGSGGFSGVAGIFKGIFGHSSSGSPTDTFTKAVAEFQKAVAQFAGGGGDSGFGGLGSLLGGGNTGGGGDSPGSIDSLFPEIPGFASGTDSAPGGLAWVGEHGPELMRLPAGASVTPSASVRAGGDQHHYYDMRGAVVTDDLMRKADFQRALSAARPGIVGEAMANFNEVQKRTPKR